MALCPVDFSTLTGSKLNTFPAAIQYCDIFRQPALKHTNAVQVQWFTASNSYAGYQYDY
jgi:hypothetical protein